jgi:hypothetical protein
MFQCSTIFKVDNSPSAKRFIDDSWNKLCTLRRRSNEPILFRVEQGVPLKKRGTMEQVV